MFPSYGPIKTKRVGYRGTTLYIYNYGLCILTVIIQGDLYEKNYLDISGKIKNDYRITSWVKFLENISLMKYLKYIIG